MQGPAILQRIYSRGEIFFLSKISTLLHVFTYLRVAC